MAGEVQDNVWPLPKFYFTVDIGDQTNLPFQEVSGLDVEAQPIEYRAGNNKVFSTIKMPGITKSSNITLKKGIFVKDNKFFDWYAKIKMNTIERVTVTIKLLDENGDPTMVWTLANAWPTKITGTDMKSDGNEVAGALAVLELLDLAGATVTADALHCHRAMAEAIRARGGDYALALKGNQSSLLRDARIRLDAAGEVARAETVATGHGRHERRHAVVIDAGSMASDHDFPGLAAIARLTSQRNDDPPVERLYLLSRSLDPERALTITRAHWDIENGLHWSLDVVLAEDDLRCRKDNAPANLAVLNRLALNLVRTVDDPKTSIRRRFKKAAWNDDYFISIISHMR